MNKKKIFNDPIYGFIEVPYPLLFDLLNHRYFQRLWRIRQLGMTHLVYPGALHTRFQHAIGAMHLTHLAVESLKSKGYSISEDDAVSVCAAVLLHDIGHGPFSHALEKNLIFAGHEELSKLYMDKLNVELKGKLSTAIDIFSSTYPKKYLCRLVSGQLDMDRLDYLNRDSFFCGVTEGIISSDRIIKMLEITEDGLAVDAKGIYSVENFIIARRLMYWQVYLHKTVIAAEILLVNILERARQLIELKKDVFATPALLIFLERRLGVDDLRNSPELLEHFSELDDFDVLTSIKLWSKNQDKILSMLSANLINRNLLRTEISDVAFDSAKIGDLKTKAQKKFQVGEEESGFMVVTGNLENKAYNPLGDRINIVYKDGKVADISEASDYLSISVLSKSVKKYFLCYPKELDDASV